MGLCNLLPFSLICPIQINLFQIMLDPLFFLNYYNEFFLNMAFLLEILIFLVLLPFKAFNGEGASFAEKEAENILLWTVVNLLSPLYLPMYLFVMVVLVPFIGISFWAIIFATFMYFFLPITAPITVLFIWQR